MIISAHLNLGSTTRARFCGRIARASAVIYAVGAGLNGLFWTVIGVLWFYAGAYGGAHLPPGAGLLFMLPPGLLFLLLSVFIWRGARWAMIAACLLVPLHWLSMLGPNPWVLLTHEASRLLDLNNLPYLFVGTALSGLLTIVSIVAAAKDQASKTGPQRPVSFSR
jgi:hypothetical protein